MFQPGFDFFKVGGSREKALGQAGGQAMPQQFFQRLNHKFFGKVVGPLRVKVLGLRKESSGAVEEQIPDSPPFVKSLHLVSRHLSAIKQKVKS